MRFPVIAGITASFFAALLPAIPGPEAFAQRPGKTVTISGDVLDFDQKPIGGNHVKVIVEVTGGKYYSVDTDDNGHYMLKINLMAGDRIDYMRFRQDAMHPADLDNLSGVNDLHIINKLMAGPFYGDPCPNEYDGLFDQLLTLERLYYRRVATGKAPGDEIEYYRTSLGQIVGPGSPIYERMGPQKAKFLSDKRAELVRLYGLVPPEPPLAALGLCARCTLNLTGDKCQAAFVALMGDQPGLYFVAGGGGGSQAHDLVCHTSIPVLVKGKVTRKSIIGPGDQVAAGKFEATSFEPNPRPQDGQNNDKLIAGVGKCARCGVVPALSNECQNIIEAKLELQPNITTPIYYWLEEDPGVRKVHMEGETYLVRGSFKIPPSHPRDRPDALTARFRASQVVTLVADREPR